MKNIFLLIAVILIVSACNDSGSKTNESANSGPTSSMAPDLADPIRDSSNFTNIQWLDSTSLELGKIKEGQTPELSWKFKNIGDKPLIIINAQGTCGCTVAEKPEQPIAPGGEGVIKAKFSSEGRAGTNEKQVIVMTNTFGTTTHYLKFKVEVEKK